jgi:hypothetical protein
VNHFGVEEVVARASEAAFGRPLVTNVLRGQIVEAMIALAIEPDWKCCSADYSSWDFERADGVRLEVKQSSYLQTWAAPAHGVVKSGFDVAARKGRWEGAVWVEEPGRAAHLYVLAYHDVRDSSADHRNPEQWEFFVIPTTDLPPVKRLTLGKAKTLTEPVRIASLRERISTVVSGR